MVGPFLLLAASVSSAPPAVPPARQAIASHQPTSVATAHARVSITVISGVRFGADQISGADLATRRTAHIIDADGFASMAELLEFQ
ncbi:MAG TPA: hypothetical protein VGD23_03970 [Sphingomicrobium sp.]